MDFDGGLQQIMNGLIYSTSVSGAVDHRAHWQVNEPLKLFLLGYMGGRNTGADVRVEEIVRQIKTILGPNKVDLTLSTFNRSNSSEYFEGAEQVFMPAFFPKELRQQCLQAHGVIAVEGSMFKSKFTNTLTLLMASALGFASRQGKLSVGYGAEVGSMTTSLEGFVRRHCSNTLVLTRNHSSQEKLEDLKMRSVEGSDTAWTFRPSSESRAAPPERWGGACPEKGLA